LYTPWPGTVRHWSRLVGTRRRTLITTTTIAAAATTEWNAAVAAARRSVKNATDSR